MEKRRGFNTFRKDIQGTNREKYVASCQSCMFMEDSCINPNVTSFDMVVTEFNTYCSFWKGYMTKNKKRRNDNE